jgi:IS30 family transposase
LINALIKHAHKLPQELYKSLTWDRGKEMADHNRFSLATDIKVYFCDPQHPWQRGSNENTNGLLRQYFLKGTDLSSTLKPNSMPLPDNKMNDPGKPWHMKHPLIDLIVVLQRSIEIAAKNCR